MHNMAEEGIAAHWKYKDGPVSARDEQRLAWLRQVVEWQRDMADPSEFLSTLKIDLYPGGGLHLHPKGKVVVLPRDATPIDFAYTIHTEVGHTCVGAKVNGRMVPLRHKLRSGDIVEILTQAGHNPSRDWLALVKSSRARQKIKHWLNVHQRERAIEIGRKLIEKEARKYRVPLKDIEDGRTEANRQRIWHWAVPTTCWPPSATASSPRARLSARLAPAAAAQPDDRQPKTKPNQRAQQRGAPRLWRRERSPSKFEGPRRPAGLSRALLQSHSRRRDRRLRHPRQGRSRALQELSQRGKPDVRIRPPHRRRVGPRRKKAMARRRYPVKLVVLCDDRHGMLKQITAVISDENTNIRNIEARTANTQANIDIVVDIEDLKHLERIITGVRKIPGVHDVQRVQKI